MEGLRHSVDPVWPAVLVLLGHGVQASLEISLLNVSTAQASQLPVTLL